MTYDEIVSKVAESTGLSAITVNKIYKTYWKVLREHIVSLPLKDNLTDEEFSKLQPNVNIPSIGKLYVTLDRYKGVKKHYQILEDLKNNKDAAHKEA